MKKLGYLFFLFFPLMAGCNNKSNDHGYFYYVEEKLEKEGLGEYVFLSLYDDELNRFSVIFNYDLHFGLTLKITEYDDQDIYIYPNEGVIEKDYESVTFNNDSYIENELFPRGTYVLKHQIKDKKDIFNLCIGEIIYPLTTNVKDRPSFMNKVLVGKYYEENNRFTFEVNRSSKKDGLISSITFIEGDKSFEASNYIHNKNESSFIVNGDADGEFIKRGNSTLKYNSNGDTYVFSNNNADYKVIKEGEGEEEKGFFYKDNFIISNEHVSIKLMNSIGDSLRYLELKELDDGGATIMGVFEITNNGENMINTQSLNGNLIFLKGNNYELKHHLIDNVDQVDLYKNNEILFENMTIQL